MEQDDKKKVNKARFIVYSLLKYRLRSEREIRNKLKLKKFSEDIIDDTVTYFAQLGLIDDRQFATRWIASRLNKPFGARRIQHELIDKGIERNIVEDEIKHAQESCCEEDIVFDLARQRRMKLEGVDPQKIKQRLFGYLSRRGFSPEAIYKAINRL